MAFSGGTYSIRPALDTSLCLDVAGLSSADGVRVQQWAWSGALDQVWDVTSVGGGYFKIINASSGKACTMTPGLLAEKRVEQWAYDGGTAEQWEVIDSGQTKTVNGTSYPLYAIKVRSSEYVMDAAGEKSAPQTDVLIRSTASPYPTKQLWLLMPTTVPNPKLLAPTNGALSRYPLKGATTELVVPSSVDRVYASWKGSGSKWQCRYRIAARTPSDAVVGDFGNWMCLANGSTANSGWGAVGTLCPTSVVNSRIRDTTGIPITLGSTYDKVRIQFEVRRFENNSRSIGGALFDARGTAASFERDVDVTVSVGVSSLVWSPAGLLVTPTPSNGRDDNTYKIWVNGLSKKWQTFAGVANGDYCCLDNALLKRIPTNGTTYTVQVKLTTIDKAEASAKVQVQCAYDSSHGLTVTANPTRIAGSPAYSIDLSAYPSRRCWVVTDSTAHEMREGADGLMWAAVPQGQAYSIYVLGEDDDGGWGTWHRDYSALPILGHALVYEGGAYTFATNLDDAPLLNVSGQTNTEASLMTGGTFEAVSAGEGRAVGGSLDTIAVYSDDEVADITDALESAVFCWYSGLRGQLWRVAVTATASTQQLDELAALTISWRRTDG